MGKTTYFIDTMTQSNFLIDNRILQLGFKLPTSLVLISQLLGPTCHHPIVDDLCKLNKNEKKKKVFQTKNISTRKHIICKIFLVLIDKEKKIYIYIHIMCMNMYKFIHIVASNVVKISTWWKMMKKEGMPGLGFRVSIYLRTWQLVGPMASHTTLP